MSKAVKSVAGIVVGAVVGYMTGGVGFAFMGAFLGGAVGQMAAQANVKAPNMSTGPSSQTVRSSKAAARFILGRASTGGVFAFIQEQGGSQSTGEWLHLVYVLSEGAIDAVEAIYLNEEPIASYGSNARHEVVINPTQVNAFLKANCPGWRDEQIGRGLSYVRISIKFDQEKFPSGIPQARFVVRGRTDLYDPRTGTTGYSNNAALAILWYLRNRCEVPDSEIVFESFAAAANVCAESVFNPGGGSSMRYQVAAVIGADEKKTDVLQKLTDTCAGNLLRIGGRWSLQVGAYYGPADFEITEDMIIGTVEGSTEVSSDDAINVIRGTFIDPSQAWAETDYPEVSMPEWIAQDGGESAESKSFPYVPDAYQAQRLANIELRRRRAAGSLSLPMNFAGYNCRPGRVVRVNLPSLNINAEVVVSNWQMGAADACAVSVKPYDPLFFDDAVGEPYEPLGFIDLPAGGMAAPTNLQWSVETDAEVLQGVLSWVSPTVMVDYFKVTVRQAGAVIQALTVPAPASRCNISGLDSGIYTIGVAAKGPMALSGETTLQVDIAGPPVPESCAVIAGNLEITLVPSNILKRLNGGTYEYFYALRLDIPPAQADYLGQGLSFTHTGLSYNTPYYYYVRSVNAYGRSSFLAVPAITASDVSGLLDALKGQIEETQIGQHLAERIDLIDGDGPGSVNDRLNEVREELEQQIGDLVDALAYDPALPYAAGDTVRGGPNGRRLYQAIQAVPLDTAPPNAAYWLDIGQAVESANGLAQQVQKNTADISAVDGQVQAQASTLEVLRAAARSDDGTGDLEDALRGWNTVAQVVEETKVRATEDEALARRITTLDASVGQNSASITELSQVVATDRQATATQLTQLKTSVDGNVASITQEATARSSADEALGTRIDQVKATADGAATSAQLTQEQQARANADSALAQQVQQVQAVAGDASSAVQITTQALAELNGKLSAMLGIKLQVNNNGQLVVAGMGIGIENTPQGMQSQILFLADRIAMMNSVNGVPTPMFTLQGGQAFFNSAFFDRATIEQLIVTGELKSPNYVAGVRGIRINFVTNDFEINSPLDNQGRMTISSNRLVVYDENNVDRITIGKLD